MPQFARSQLRPPDRAVRAPAWPQAPAHRMQIGRRDSRTSLIEQAQRVRAHKLRIGGTRRSRCTGWRSKIGRRSEARRKLQVVGGVGGPRIQWRNRRSVRPACNCTRATAGCHWRKVVGREPPLARSVRRRLKSRAILYFANFNCGRVKGNPRHGASRVTQVKTPLHHFNLWIAESRFRELAAPDRVRGRRKSFGYDQLPARTLSSRWLAPTWPS